MVPNIVSTHPSSEENTIRNFFSGSCVFITGGTGFIGKVVIEKLLHSCPDVDTIYILVREKRGKTATTRLEEFFKCEMFSKLENDWRPRVKLVEGELGTSSISPVWDTKMREEMMEKVNIVLHCAATVRFDEELCKAININVKGTNDVITLCKTMRNLRSVVHVSTAYSQSNKGERIEERFYDPSMKPEIAMGLAELKDNDILKVLAPKVMEEWPNSYTFTKALAEDLIRTAGKTMPISVFRPAIVIGTTNNSTVPGYVDNLNGPNGLSVGVIYGLIRAVHMRGDLPAQTVPGDLCANAILAIAWRTGTEPRQMETPIYNYVPRPENGLTVSEFIFGAYNYGEGNPIKNVIWVSSLKIIPNRLGYLVLRFLLHTIPAILMDTMLIIRGKKTKILKLYEKIHRNLDILEPFSMEKWTFEYNNMMKLQNSLLPSEKTEFNMDLDTIEYDKYLPVMADGIKTFLIKVKPSDRSSANQRYFRMMVVHYSVKYVVIIMFLYFLWISIKYRLFGTQTGHFTTFS